MNELTTTNQNTAIVAGYTNSLSFEFMQRQAQMLASSALMPKEFSIVGCPTAEKATKIANVMIALEMANRIGASPMMVAQNIYIVHGKPSWSSTFIIAAINGCGRFSAMKFEMTGEGDNRTCIAKATEKLSGDVLDSPPVSIEMAKSEGWYGKSGSKWKTMPELMLRYRAATLFGRLYTPEILMGMRAVEELEDTEDAKIVAPPKAASVMERFKVTQEAIDEAAEIPITAEEIADATPPVEEVKNVVKEKIEPVATSDDLLQETLALLATLAKAKGETADDMIDMLTKGKLTCQSDLMDKPDPFLNDIKLMLKKELSKEP